MNVNAFQCLVEVKEDYDGMEDLAGKFKKVKNTGGNADRTCQSHLANVGERIGNHIVDLILFDGG